MYKRFLLGFAGLLFIHGATAHVCDNSKITIHNSSSHTLEVGNISGEDVTGISNGLSVGAGEHITVASNSSNDKHRVAITLSTDDGETIKFTTLFQQQDRSDVCSGIIPACPCLLKISDKTKYTVASDKHNGTPAHVSFYVIDAEA